MTERQKDDTFLKTAVTATSYIKQKHRIKQRD